MPVEASGEPHTSTPWAPWESAGDWGWGGGGEGPGHPGSASEVQPQAALAPGRWPLCWPGLAGVGSLDSDSLSGQLSFQNSIWNILFSY